GLRGYEPARLYAEEILQAKSYATIAKTRYVNDKQITDHYAIVPTGQGLGTLKSLSALSMKIYEVLCRRFLSIFYPAAIYQKYTVEMMMGTEHFFSGFRVLVEPGYLKVAEVSDKDDADTSQNNMDNPEFIRMLGALKKGSKLDVNTLTIKEGETSPPKRYTSGAMILARESAGQLIEDEELRAQIKGSGIGTSATRAEILKKLVHIKYLALNGKTQIIMPTLLGEMIFDVVNASIRQLLNPDLTASWEKGLTYVAEGSITPDE
ncbi:MAG: DNA topoisomerase, partial [Hungatella sp.]